MALEVMGTSDVKALLGVERQRQLLGCTETSCSVEISSALGARWLVAGSLAQAGQTMRLDLKLIDAHDSRVVFRDGAIIKNQSEVFDMVSELTRRLRPSLGQTPSTTVAVQSAVGPWVVVGAGAAAAITGGVLLGLGFGQRTSMLNSLSQPVTASASDVPTYSSARESLLGADTQMIVGTIVASVGLVGVITGLTWRVTMPNESAVAVRVSLGSSSLLISGAF